MAYQQQYPQPQQMQQQAPAAAGNDPWNPTSGGGGCSEFVMTVKECKPDSNKQDPTKQNITWSGVDHEGKQRIKSWGIGKDWSFDWASMPPRYVDPKNPGRGINENTTMGILLRCIRDGAPYDLRDAAAALKSKPGGPLSPAVWAGSRWHFCKVNIDFGQGPREVLWPIAFLGYDGTPLPPVNWRTADHTSGGFGAQVPAPNGQMAAPVQQQPMGQPQYQQPQQQANMMQQPQYQQPQQPQQGFGAAVPAQYQQPQQQQPMYQQPQQQQPQQGGQYENMPPQGYGMGAHPGYQPQGGGPAAGPGFPG